VSKLRILLADDHETVRTGLRVILDAQADMEVVGEAADGQAVIEKATELRPDVVLMDVSMPRLNGLQATKTLRERAPAVKVLTLTRHGDVAYLHQLLEAGASGYVLKQSRAAEVLQAIRAITRGGTYIDSAMTADALAAAPVRAIAVGRGRAAVSSLSPREADTLRLVARGYSNKAIAGQLNVSVKTIETHKGNAMHKLGMRNRIDIVRYAMLQGWLDET
jgi:two-component system, NarL family, response regulator NreC